MEMKAYIRQHFKIITIITAVIICTCLGIASPVIIAKMQPVLSEELKVVSFKMENKAMQEEGLAALKDIKKLKSFKYPVTDSSVYEGCHELEEIGIDAKGTFQFEVFKDSKLRSVMVYHADGEEEVENIVDEIKKYVKITCYGYTTKK